MRRQFLGEVFRIAQDHGQQIVEIVRHAAGELANGFHFLGLAEFLIEVVDRGALVLERLGGPVEQPHQPAEFAARMGRGNPRAEIAKSEPGRHRGDAFDLAADTHFRQYPYACEQQQHGHREDRHILVKPAVGGRHQTVLGQSDHDMKSGVPDRGRAGDRPDMAAAVRIGRLAEALAARCGRKPEQLGIRDRGAGVFGPNLAGIGDEDRTFPVDEQDFACAGMFVHQALVMILREFLQIERSQQDEFQLRRFRAYGVGDLQHRCPRQPAERRFQRDGPLRGQGLLEIFAVPEVEAAVGLQRVAEQAAVGIDGQYPRELRIFLAHGGKKSRTHRLVACVEIAGTGQAVMKLGGALNLLVEVAGNIICGCRQLDQRGVDFAAAVLDEAQPHQNGRHQHCHDNQ